MDKIWKNMHVPDYSLFLHKMKQSLEEFVQTCDWEVQNARIIENDCVSAKGKQVGGYGVGDSFEEPSYEENEFQFPSRGAAEIVLTVDNLRDFPEVAALRGFLRTPITGKIITKLVTDGVVGCLQFHRSSYDIEDDMAAVIEDEDPGGYNVSWGVGKVFHSGKATTKVTPKGFRITVPVVVKINVDSATIDYDHGFEPPYEYGY